MVRTDCMHAFVSVWGFPVMWGSCYWVRPEGVRLASLLRQHAFLKRLPLLIHLPLHSLTVFVPFQSLCTCFFFLPIKFCIYFEFFCGVFFGQQLF